MYCIKKCGVAVIGVAMALWLGAQTASAAMASALTQVKVIKVESQGCGLENIVEKQEQTSCDHSGPSIKVYVLEIGYGSLSPHVALDGFEVDGNRTSVCAYQTGNLKECAPGEKTVGNLYIFNLAGKQDGIFTFSNTSINAPRNTMSTQLYIK
ncbi:DUF4879 domain-containing protein [Pseudomonas sp. 31-12]|uniref:DUF4879 domain-containing protein n=1 Tax=Pseudomonas sp. 31-12 TaxID=2201356 RepID=UPI000D6DB60F|nr:DUF4879 domain-containing protein [Pseudomonas sp. 31-12]AWM94422.1 DUF4879 domain-containing protein [Pseudomonas sp. 31-12]